ncbi:hypothetical protein KJ032_27200, partial [Salmonella enterica subsp. enterica serovar Typhimurium]|nr:hypothetical protein [Salmonella enterica subsp. enterica serovar Typhimurium]
FFIPPTSLSILLFIFHAHTVLAHAALPFIFLYFSFLFAAFFSLSAPLLFFYFRTFLAGQLKATCNGV